jgi:hypothetical protein
MDKGPSLPVRLGLAGVLVVSVLAALVVEAELLAAALVVLGTAALFVPMLWVGPAYLRFPKATDERYEQLNYRAGWYAYVLLAWVVMVYYFLVESVGVDLPVVALFYAVVGVSFVYWSLEWWLARNPEPWR